MIKWIILLHVLGAAIWTGGHLVLAIGFLPRALKHRDPEIINRFEETFEKIGIPALLTQVATGLYMAWFFGQGFLGWFGFSNHFSVHISLKLILLFVTLVFAVHARLFIIPKLTQHNLRFLAWHIITVTVLSVLFVAVGVSYRTGGLF